MLREKKVGLVSATGASFEIIKCLVQRVEQLGGDENDVRQLLNPNLRILQDVAKLIAGTTAIVWKGTVEIDHSKTYCERVKSYGMILTKITKYYPIQPREGIDRVKLALVRFRKSMEVVAVEEVLEKLCLKHSTAEDAFAFGGQYPHVVYKFENIVSLGDSNFSELKPPVSPMSDEPIPFGKIGSKVYFYHEALSLSWSRPGNLSDLTLSTYKFFNRTWPGCCILCRKKD